MNRGNSFANGLESAGASVNNGPHSASFQQGWVVRPASIWDHLEPGMYQ